ncbi:MAG: sulfotransferase [Bacteroidales bacterium]|nr:sulfotransferase [Bacteroidales bacterium]
MEPIFIIGIAGRSGTHYLKQLLKKHQDVQVSLLNREDHFVSELNYLELYVKNISYFWKRNDKEHEEKIVKNLKKGLGDGIIKSIHTKEQTKYFLLNTPYTHNIHLFKEYFPDKKLIIITRNAKDLVESGVRSKFWNYEEGFELWNRSAKRIIEFKNKNKDNFLIVKYEDLFLNTENELKKIFEYLNIKSDKYPFETLNKIPVQGSSDAKNEKKTWEYKNIKSNENFRPLTRAEKWGTIRKWRFNWKCGKNSFLLNYKDAIIKNYPLYYFINFILDVILSIYKIKLSLKHIIKKYYTK